MATARDAISKFITQAQLETYFVEVVGMITVKAYGAKGDGTTDDTQAILDALDAVNDNSLASLYFPHGTYLVDSDLISAGDFSGIFCWGDNSSFSGISHPINQIGTNISLVTTFLGLTDTPATFAGQGGKVVAVNNAEDALEFVDVYTKAEVDTALEDYYTSAELDAGQLDNRYFTESELISTTNGNSGANNIGLTAYDESPENLQDAFEWLKDQLDAAILGAIVDGSITNIKLDNDIKVGSLALLTTSETSNVVGAINEIDGDVGDISTLTTTDKTSLVAAINEIDSDITGVVSQTYVDAGDFENSLQTAKGLFLLEANVAAGKNDLSQLTIDAFNDSTGISDGESSNYSYDGTAKSFKPASAIRTSTQKTVTANGNARIRTNGIGKTVTANGNAQIDTAQYKVGSSSGLFDGTGDYLSIADSSYWDFGTGDFEIHCYMRYNALPVSGGKVNIFRQYADANNFQTLTIYNDGGTYKIDYYFNIGGAGLTNPQFPFTTPSTGTWYHYSFMRIGGNFKAYVDGVEVGTPVANSTNITGISAQVEMFGQSSGANILNGWVDEVEILKGSTRHSGDFTPSTTALAAIANYTVLLLHCEGADASTNFSDDSDISILPKIGTGMGYFDGTGDYLSVSDNDDWNLGTGAFTLSTYGMLLALPSSGSCTTLISQYTDDNNYWFFGFYNNSGTYQLKFLSMSSGVLTSVGVNITTPTLSTWYHYRCLRTGNNIRFFIDGTQVGTDQAFNVTVPDLSGTLRIGYYSAGNPYTFNGYLDDLEIAKGIARDSATNFTPSVTALVPDQYTVLLLHMDGTNDSTTFTDEMGNWAPMTIVSNALTAISSPSKAYYTAYETLNGGTVTYCTSRDGGTTWTAITEDTLTDISSQPAGTSIKIKAVTSGSAYSTPININGWAYGYKV